MKSTIIFAVLCLVVLTSSHPTENRTHVADADERNTIEPFVYLTVSSLVPKNGPDRLLELNWDQVEFDQDETKVNLYDQDPRLNADSQPLVSVVPSVKGYFRTSVRFPHHVFTPTNLTDDCLGFWIALVSRDGEIVTSSCLRARPNWMHDARQDIGHLSLLDLMVPGTHNTGSYAHFDPDDDSLFNRYVFTQDEDVFHQLAYGIRYLDLRVAYHGHLPQKFWVTHSTFRVDVPVRSVLRQVRAFLEATQEVVVLDFHRFVTGFQNRRSASTRMRHQELLAMLETELGEFMVPAHFTSGATLNQLWESGKRLYVGYADDRSRSRNQQLFPAIRHLWGDVDDPDDLHDFLNATVCKPRARLSSAMAQLTPTAAGLLFNSYGGLRKMADFVNRRADRWFRQEWRRCANIVATDFFLGNNVVELALRTNRERGAEAAARDAANGTVGVVTE